MEFKRDIGLTNPNGVVTAKVMKALLNMSSYRLNPTKGNPKIRQAQQNMNRDYNDYFGYLSTDGLYSRETNKVLIYSLQAEEGLSTSVANGTFGPTTIALCPTLSRGSTGEFVRILQYALICNGSEYDTGELDGIFGAGVETAVRNFQRFMALPITGVANMSTIKQLMTSNGDTNRSAKACDTSFIINDAKAETLVNNGIEIVGRYLSGTVNGLRSKALTVGELNIIFNHGLRVFTIFQEGGAHPMNFIKGKGTQDAHKAIAAAKRLGFGNYTTIYFAVDFDAYDYEVTELIIPYFREISSVFNKMNALPEAPFYKIGIYGSRNTCTRVSELELAAYSFVADMSTGYSGNLGFPMPSNWAFDQFFELPIGSGAGLIDIDKCGYSGRDIGIGSVNPPNKPLFISIQQKVNYSLSYSKATIITKTTLIKEPQFTYELEFQLCFQYYFSTFKANLL